MPPSFYKSRLARYLLAVITTGVAFGLTGLLWGDSELVPTHLFLLSVVVSAWIGGLLPGLFATALASLVISFYYIEPGTVVVNVESVLQIFAFATVASVISLIEEHRFAFQAELMETKNELEAILTGTMDGIVAYNRDGRPIFANPAAATMFGYESMQALLADKPGSPDDPYEMLDTTGQRIQRLDLPLWQALEKGEPVEQIITIKTRDDQRRAVNVRVSIFDSIDDQHPTAISVLRDVTELHEKEEALRQQKRLLEVTLESIGDGVITTDATGNIEFLNPVAQQLTGWDAENAKGLSVRDVFQVVHAQTDDPITNPVQEALQNEAVVTLPPNVNLVTRDGQQLAVDDSVAPIIDDAGKNQGAIVVFRDTTERRRIMQALEHSQRHTKRILDNLSAYVWVLRPNGIVQETNHTAAPLYDATETQQLLFYNLEWIPDAKRADIQALLKDVQDEQEPQSMDIEIHPAGQEVLVLGLVMSPLLGDDSTLTHIIVSGTNITHRLRAEKNLRQANVLIDTQRRRLDHLLSNVPGMIWETIEDAEVSAPPVKYVNSYGETMLGYTADEWKTRNDLWEKVIHPDEFADVVQKTIEIFRSDKPYGSFSTRCVRKDGSEFDAELYLRIIPVDGQPGKFHLYGLMMDVSEREHSRRMLADTNERLRRSNEEVKRFAYVASHDLQEPLRMVTSYLQLIDRRYRDALDEDGVEFIDFAVDGAQRMKVLINDLLQYSRVETRGKITGSVDLNEVLQNVLRDLGHAIEEAEATVEVDDLPTLNADAGQMRQLFQNFIGNALKFQRKGIPARVSITAKEQRWHWRFCIEDNGIGIEDKYKDRIFNIFQRLHTRDEYSGTGIGLAICRKVVEQHNGDIWFKSQVGQGTKFYFTISKSLTGVANDESD